MTDIPSFVSGRYIVYFDPQAKFLPDVNPANPGTSSNNNCCCLNSAWRRCGGDVDAGASCFTMPRTPHRANMHVTPVSKDVSVMCIHKWLFVSRWILFFNGRRILSQCQFSCNTSSFLWLWFWYLSRLCNLLRGACLRLLSVEFFVVLKRYCITIILIS